MVCNMVLFQLQWRERREKGGREITESERGGQRKMRGGKGQGKTASKQGKRVESRKWKLFHSIILLFLFNNSGGNPDGEGNSHPLTVQLNCAIDSLNSLDFMK